MKVSYCKIKRMRVRHYSTMDLSGLVVYFWQLNSCLVFLPVSLPQWQWQQWPWQWRWPQCDFFLFLFILFVVWLGWQFDNGNAIGQWTMDMTFFDLYDCDKDMTWYLTTKSDIGQHSNSCLIFVVLGSVFVRLLVVCLIVVVVVMVVVFCVLVVVFKN